MDVVILGAALCLTNLAGRAITATPVRLEGAAAVFAHGAVTSSVPLAAFPASEQARIRAALGRRILPAGLRELRTIYAADLARAEARRAGGAMSEEAFARKAARIRGAWEHSLGKGEYGLSEGERNYWKGHLR